MKGWQIFLVAILLIGALIGLSYGFGWIGVHQTKTIGKAKQNAQREVFEQSQSYVEGKRQEALKLYKEYGKLTDYTEKQSFKTIVSNSFANFDEEKYLSGELQRFIHDMKYN